MRQKVEITAEQAEKLKAAGICVESRYYMYVEAVMTTFTGGVPTKKKDEDKADFSTIAPSARQQAPRGCEFKLASSVVLGEVEGVKVNTALHNYLMQIVLSVKAARKGATTVVVNRQYLAEDLLRRVPYLRVGKNPMGSAKAYISRAYQLGILEIK